MKKIFIVCILLTFCLSMYSQTMETIKTQGKADGRLEQYVGSILVTGEVLNGKKTGNWVENHPKSELPHYIVQYKDGVKHGLYIEIDKNGYILSKSEYNEGKLNGECCQWYRSGRLSKKQVYKDGLLNGKSIICYDKGYKQEEAEYKDGKRDGITIWYAYGEKEEGPKAAMYTYKKGLFEGVQETYYDDGTLKSSKMFSNNQANGSAVEFYEDGSVKTECAYKNGEIIGKVKEYKKGEKTINN